MATPFAFVYRPVGAHEYEKTERAYERLSEHLNRARRARMIPMDVIRDDGGTILVSTTWRDAAEYLAAVREEAKELLLDRTVGQPTRLVVRCEAVGMAPQLERVTGVFCIRCCPAAASTASPRSTSSPPS